MDTVSSVVRRLKLLSSFAVVVFMLVGSFLVPSVAWSQTSYSSYGAADSACNSAASSDNVTFKSNGITVSCSNEQTGSPATECYVEAVGSTGGDYGLFIYPCSQDPAGNPCSSIASSTGDFSYSAGQSLPAVGGRYATDPVSGAQVWCPSVLTYSGVPTEDDYGHLHVQVTQTYSGNPASSAPNGVSTNGSTYMDAGDNVLNPQPTVTPGSSPDLCGGASCYDPNNNTFTGAAGSAAANFALSGSTADSSAGGCSSSGASTMCAGSPNPPLPPAPPGSEITDPSTQVTGSDTFTQQNPTTGALQTVTVTTYTGQGGKTTSGASSGSIAANGNGPGAPASSSSSSGDGVSGGGSCTSPPACTGDAVECAELSQTYDTRCNVAQVHTDLAGTSTPPASGQHQPSEVDGGTIDLGNQMNSLDTSGLNLPTSCPFAPVSGSFGSASVTIDFSFICPYEGFFSSLILLLATMKCADILARG